VDGMPSWQPATLTYSNGLAGGCAIEGEVVGQISGAVDCCGGSTLIETWTVEFCESGGGRALPNINHSRTITILPDTNRPLIDQCLSEVDLGNIVGEPSLSDLPPPYTSYEEFTSRANLPSNEIIEIDYSESGPIVNGCVYTFQRVYTLVDQCGLEAMCTQVFTVSNDSGLPTIEGVPSDTVVSCGVSIDDIPWPDVRAYNSEGEPIPVQRRAAQGAARCGGDSYTRIFTTNGNCGSTVSRRYTIRFEDDVPPMLDVPSDTTINCGEDIPEPFYTARDNCSQVTVTLEEEASELATCERIIERTWTASDGCGNTTVKTQRISINDAAPPSIVVINPGLHGVEDGSEVVTFDCDPPQVTPSDIEISDDCCVDLSTLVTFDRLVSTQTCEIFGYYRRWLCGYTVSDGAGNETSLTFYVLQYDTIAPTIEGIPPDLELTCEDSLLPPPDIVIATDACHDHPLDVAFTEELVFDPTDPMQWANVRTWRTEDFCGNVAEAHQVISFCGFDESQLQRSIGNMVWLDLNGDGMQNAGEEGLNGVEMIIYKVDSLGENRQVWDRQVTQTVGSQHGLYAFSDLPDGHYLAELKVPDGLALTLGWQGEDRKLDSDFIGVRAQSKIIHMDSLSSYMDIDAGLVLDPEWNPAYDFSGSTAAGCVHQLTVDLSHGQDIKEVHLQVLDDNDLYRTVDSFEASSIDFPLEIQIREAHWSDQERQHYRAKFISNQGFPWNSPAIELDASCRNRSAKAFPNPARSSVFFESERVIDRGDFELIVRDVLGKTYVVHDMVIFRTDRMIEIPLGAFPAGQYAIQLISKDHSASGVFVRL
ncbi:MAG: hypothetical protein KTR24_13110, partial [Saprospiraceae bacterium]|nr:hypothetical protein [Saprospiraceae bacterium]